MTMTAAIKRFVLNCLFSLQKYGKQRHYIVVTFDPQSLVACKTLNLPCFNGSGFLVTDSETLTDGKDEVGKS